MSMRVILRLLDLLYDALLRLLLGFNKILSRRNVQ